jgi:hypothetical protein
MKARIILAQALIFLIGAANAAPAQSTSIRGHVYVLGDTTRGVRDAEVTLFPSGRTARTDSAGVFDVVGESGTSYRLRVRRVGFAEWEHKIEVAEANAPVVQVALTVAPRALSEVKISGHRVLVPARYADAYSRVARATGDFFTRERIDSLHALDMKSLLQTIPGVHINDRGMTFQRCEATLSSVKIPGSISGASKEPETSSTSQAHIQVYIDGVRVTDYAGSYGDDAYLAIRYIIPSSVQLVEVYRGVASIPGEFLNDACAVILIWTK